MSLPPDNQDGLGGWLAHLVELRARLLRAVLAVVVIFLALLPFSRRLYTQLAEPLLAALPTVAAGGQMVAIDPLAPFTVPLRLTLYAALLLAMPVLLYQAWAYVAPGLYKHERRLALPLLVCAVLLFYAGFAFAYFFLLPVMFQFLLAMNPDGVAVMTDIGRYLDFVSVISIACGMAFQVPVAVVVLAMLHVVNAKQLAEMRGYAIIAMFVIAMLITPGDGISMIMMAVPMCLLYEAGVITVRMLERSRKASSAAQ